MLDNIGQNLGSYGAGTGANGKYKNTHIEKHRRINVIAVILNVLMPTFIFSSVLGLVSFHIHYSNPGLCWFGVASAFCIAIAFSAFAFHTIRRRQMGDMPFDSPTWLVFLCGSSLIAWVLGLTLGEWNYNGSMLAYYKVQTLQTYTDVNPASTSGGGVMDGGRFTFSASSRIMTEYAVAFKKDRTYCAAPVTSIPKGEKGQLASYDFWTVGIDCCSGEAGDFHCGDIIGTDMEGHNVVKLSGGSRVIDDEAIPWFSLAVQQAEAFYHIKAGHAIFVQNRADPLSYGGLQHDKGVKFFCFCCFLFFGMQSFFVALTLVAFAKAYNHTLGW